MSLGYARLFAATTLALIGTACSSVGGADEGTTYSLGSTACTLQSSLTVSNDASIKWSGCTMHYDADAHVVTWQLVPAGGSSGSLLSPGANVVVFSFDRDAPENSTFRTAGFISPLPASVPAGQTVFAYGTSGGREGGNGQTDVGSNVVSQTGGGGSLSGDVSIKLTNGATLSGSFQAAAGDVGGVSSGGGTSGGSTGSNTGAGNCSDNGASCKSTGNCANGGQYACYCAAAATYQCFLAHGCYAEAGAMTSVTKSQLESGCSTSLSQASSLGGGTCGGLSCQ